MNEITVGRFAAYNPHIEVNDSNKNGVVDAKDVAIHLPSGETMTWADGRYSSARAGAKKGLRAFDYVLQDPLALVAGVAANVVFAEALMPISVLHALFGSEGNFATRFANTWTYFPRAFGDY